VTNVGILAAWFATRLGNDAALVLAADLLVVAAGN
jgi:hypothetical protein